MLGTKTKITKSNTSNREVERWYIFSYPSKSKGLTEGLEREIRRRKACGEPAIEYFAPTFIDVSKSDGKLIRTKKNLLYNYFFIHGSELELFKMKTFEPQYSFLKREASGKGASHFPFVPDDSIALLKWIADSYSGMIPLYAIDPVWLVQGDKVLITKGPFKGMVATLFRGSKPGEDKVMVYVDGWSWVPLLSVEKGEYELVSLHNEEVSPYCISRTDSLAAALHSALLRFLGGTLRPEDKALAKKVIAFCDTYEAETDVLRSKKFAMLLSANTILEDKESKEGLICTIRLMIEALKAEQSKALLYTTLYACTNNWIFFDKAHSIIDPWMREEAPKKSKQRLAKKLSDFDTILGHK